ncbi:guanylate kinase [Anoxybacter fermentans]|uniref:Guanylate kinase n=1 Tax=Anoxybacter fermentans TaxID=1323375 RepID=A0A3Q9HPY1_9FIRM|nr:guanylate kinase [Anoxybacter fermentans]AZR72975.1 guanylate kinase [Anoxybacter fermentans]
MKGKLFVLSGPSGVGKGTVRAALLKEYSDINYSVSATTRAKREGEVHGREYFFVSVEEFQEMIKNDELLEWAKYCGNYYGTPRKYVEEKLKAGEDIILEIEIQGAEQIRKKFPDGVFIFLAPPSLNELRLRIQKRGTEDETKISERLETAKIEMEKMYNYDYVIINDVVENAVEKLKSIIIAERCRIENYIGLKEGDFNDG